MTRAELATIGEALYGPRWQSELARALGVGLRRMQRWAAGDFAIPDGVRADIRALALRRLIDIRRVLRTGAPA